MELQVKNCGYIFMAILVILGHKQQTENSLGYHSSKEASKTKIHLAVYIFQNWYVVEISKKYNL